MVQVEYKYYKLNKKSDVSSKKKNERNLFADAPWFDILYIKLSDILVASFQIFKKGEREINENGSADFSLTYSHL